MSFRELPEPQRKYEISRVKKDICNIIFESRDLYVDEVNFAVKFIVSKF